MTINESKRKESKKVGGSVGEGESVFYKCRDKFFLACCGLHRLTQR
jgi:hypothetical protein